MNATKQALLVTASDLRKALRDIFLNLISIMARSARLFTVYLVLLSVPHKCEFENHQYLCCFLDFRNDFGIVRNR